MGRVVMPDTRTWRQLIEDGDAVPTEINGEHVMVPPIPDFTPNVGPQCDARSPSQLTCTLHPHEGLHVAGNGDQIVGIWYDKKE